jgi:L-asparaginase II
MEYGGAAARMTNPVLIEVTRGPLVECVHRGTLAVVSAAGEIAVSLGAVDHPVFPRSAVKGLQAMPLIETGAADAFGLRPGHIALAAASHAGTERHVAVARDMLARAGLNESALACGVHPPLDEAAARALWATGQRPGVLHHNCSGKHAGMLATARYMREDIDEYWSLEHPVQQRIGAVIEEVAQVSLTPGVCGIDGCSVPNWALPVRSLAFAYARLAAGANLSAARKLSARRIMDAAWAEPELAAGIGRLDTHVLTILKGEAYIKTGAEGVYGGVFPGLGLGFALKIDDGAPRASDAVTRLVVEAFLPAARGKVPLKTLKNAQGKDVGVIRPSQLLALALS